MNFRSCGEPVSRCLRLCLGGGSAQQRTYANATFDLPTATFIAVADTAVFDQRAEVVSIASLVRPVVVGKVEGAITASGDVVRSRDDVWLMEGPDELNLLCIRVDSEVLDGGIGTGLLLVQELSSACVDRWLVVDQVQLDVVVSVHACESDQMHSTISIHARESGRLEHSILVANTNRYIDAHRNDLIFETPARGVEAFYIRHPLLAAQRVRACQKKLPRLF